MATNCVSVHRIYIALEPSLDGKEPTAFKAVVLSYSHHTSMSREIPIPGIEEHPDIKPVLLNILGSAPVNQFLRVKPGKQGLSATLLSPSLQEAVAG